MKKLLTIALLMTAATATGQKLELGAGVGIYKNSAPLSNYIATRAAAIKPTGEIQAAVNLAGFQVGAKISFLPISYRSWNTQVYHATFATIPVIFANKTFNLHSTMLYIGANGGYVYGSNKSTPDVGESLIGKRSTGYTVGAQAGAAANVTKRIGIGGELGFRYLNIAHTAGAIRQSFIGTSVTAQVRYRF